MKRIHFNCIEWTVDFENGNIRPSDEEVKLGYTDYCKQAIIIRDGMSYELTYQTLLHELTHAAVFSYGFSGRTYTEEELCEFIGAHGERIAYYAQDIMLERIDDGADYSL